MALDIVGDKAGYTAQDCVLLKTEYFYIFVDVSAFLIKI